MFKKIIIKKGMSKYEVNKLISNYLVLEDEVYLGNHHKHKWKCKCGNHIESRMWDKIKSRNSFKCKECKYSEREEHYKHEVEKTGEYKYIKAYFKGDILPSGKNVKTQTYIQIKHKYCGNMYEVIVGGFINTGIRCGKCCKTYENSFAHHIEVELGEPLDKYWDFDKNVVNPYFIYKNFNKHKVWIKCTNEETNELNYLMKKDYHGSYEILCSNFTLKKRCNYCSSYKVHTYDSFGYHNFDKVMSWHPDNDVSPFRIALSDNKKYEFICEECENVFGKTPSKINIRNEWCPRCSSSKGEKRVAKWLIENNIDYIHDKPYFKNLLSDKGNPLRPDFILEDKKIWIEYDGEFHYKDFYKDGSYETLMLHDKRKNEYAKSHGWKIIRIPYWDFDNIENILEVNVY